MMPKPRKTDRCLEAAYPNLAADGYEIKGCACPHYNCAALADSPRKRWLRPATDTEGLIRFYELKGWQRCDDGEPADGFIKLAIYEEYAGIWSHVAVLQKNGKWLSKLGGSAVIEHNTVAALEGFTECAYGQCKYFMQRPRLDTDP